MVKLLLAIITLILSQSVFSQSSVNTNFAGDTLPDLEFDSISQEYLKRLNFQLDDSLLVTSDLKNSDSIKVNVKSFFKKIDVGGVVSVGHDYGLLTGYIDTTNSRNLNVLRTNGELDISYLGLPINFSYNYTTLRNPLGANNYFRFSLDTDKLSQKVEERKTDQIGDLDSKISEVKEKKGILNGKLGYGEVLMNMLKKREENERKRLDKELLQLQQKSAEIKLNESVKDTTGNFIDTNVNYKQDSILQNYENLKLKYESTLRLYDTITKLYSIVKQSYDTYNELQSQLEQKKEQLSGLNSTKLDSGLVDRFGDSLQNSKQSFLESIKTLDIGLTYPQISGLSENSAPIKGLNIEIQHNKWYYALAMGVTLNNTLVSTDVIENKLIYSENLFNQFDFQKVTKNGFLISAKSGYGNVDGTHAFLGIRYLTNSRFAPEYISLTDSLVIPSIGLEIDLKWNPKFSQTTTFDLVYGKTSSSSKVIDGDRPNAWSSLFSSDRTNTGLFSIGQAIPKLRSDIIASIRIIDPLADMRSLGVLQPNNLRYELKTMHRISSRINFGLNYRYDRNNVDSRLDTTASLNIFGAQFGGAIGKRVHYSATLNYLVQNLENRSQLNLRRVNNYIFGFVVSSNYKVKGLENVIGLNYNEFLLTDSISSANYRTIGIQNSTLFSKSSNMFSVNYFLSSGEPEPVKSTAFIVSDDFSISMNRVKLTVGAKLAFSKEYGNTVGGKLECLSQLTNFMDLLFRAERFVLGDFYNSYDRDRFNRFPYLVTIQLNFKIK